MPINRRWVNIWLLYSKKYYLEAKNIWIIVDLSKRINVHRFWKNASWKINAILYEDQNIKTKSQIAYGYMKCITMIKLTYPRKDVIWFYEWLSHIKKSYEAMPRELQAVGRGLNSVSGPEHVRVEIKHTRKPWNIAPRW